ncbi:MAG: alpha/beta hydrolase [Chloroflexota bacterium]|nr:alpha/beta hydrolase [Dehalococcoidia bacterium]MDW8253543.1 alpha/beta hydrolase [Chloroflexota bacterium]
MSLPTPQQRRVPANGITLAVHDWGGSGAPLLAVHGNSFHGRIWDVTLRQLWPDYRSYALDLRGHGDSDTPEQGYSRFDHAADIVAVVEALGLRRPVVLAHSVGAISTLLAASMAPDRFGPMVLIEPVIRPKTAAAPWLPSAATATLAEQARRRRHRWPSREAAVAHYRTKPAFASWQPEVLALYVEHGFRDQPDGSIELKCPGWVEALGYEASPAANPWPHLPAVACPVLLVRAGTSRLFSEAIAADLAAALPNARVVTVPDRSHALPMEDPALVARIARAFFAEHQREMR